MFSADKLPQVKQDNISEMEATVAYVDPLIAAMFHSPEDCKYLNW
jgi:hypothetical protein